MNIDQVIHEIYNNLDEIAKEVLTNRIKGEKNAIFQKFQKKFLRELDSPIQHQPRWHQWGIITHTRKFIYFYDNQLQKDLKKWNIFDRVNASLSVKIDGIPKSKLIYIGILLHDIGKFHKNYKLKDNQVVFNFKNHEYYSYEIIKNDLFHLLHNTYKLTIPQIEYIAQCAKYHFKLGIIREFAKKSPQGYTKDFAHSYKFKTIVLDDISKLKEHSLEIGLLFLADSYAKSDIDYHRNDTTISRELKEKKLHPKLIDSIKQIEINREIAKSYFSILNYYITKSISH